MKFSVLQLLLLAVPFFALFFETGNADAIYDDFKKCQTEEGFGNVTLICDREHQLKPATVEKLEGILQHLQDNVPCQCTNKCDRGGDLSDKYIGLFLVTTSGKAEAASTELNETAKQIYDEAQLGNDLCDNGVLIIFNKDTQKLATYRGKGHFSQLSDEDLARIHEISQKGTASSENPFALEYLLGDQGVVDSRPDVQRAESWAPVVGLTVALVIIVLILGILMALLLARLCCCCFRRSKKKEKYHVTRVPTYKTIDPIYIVTNERPAFPPGPHSDVIYSTPYSGTPVPPATFTATNFMPPPPPHGRLQPSRSVTPTSLHRVKIHSMQGSVRSPEETPEANKKDRVNRTSTIASKHSTATTPETIPIGGSATSPTLTNTPTVNTPNRRPLSVVSGGTSTIAPVFASTPHPEDDSTGLPFLDPRRPQEVQTKEDFIF